jgi:hypothetical protein
MPSHIELTPETWERLREQLKKDYPFSVLAIREKQKRVLGFTERNHWTFNKETDRWNRPIICLDFYSEKKRTFFLMKYSELLDNNSK